MAKETAKADKASKDKTKDNQEAAGEGEEGAQPKKKNRLKFLLLILVVLLAAGGGAAWYFMQPKGDAEAVDEAPAEAKPAEPEAPPIFVTLEPFTVNLLSDGGDHYLQVGIDLKVADEKVPEQVKLHMPEIRNSVLLLLSSKHVSDLVTVEGKNKLRTEIRRQVNQHLGIAPPEPAAAAPAVDAASAPAPAETQQEAAAEEPQEGVLSVLLTSFVIQ